jgi:hypothetical protein
LSRRADARHAAARLADLLRVRIGAPLPTVGICVHDPAGRSVGDVVIEKCDPDPAPSDCSGVLDAAVHDLDTDRRAALVVLGLTRPGPLSVQPFDRAWFRALHRVCHSRGLSVGAVYVVGRHEVRTLQIDDAA